MSGKSKYRYFKRKRYCARIVVPQPLQAIIGKKELTKALGADQREAERRRPRAVAAMLDEIERAERQLYGDKPSEIGPRSPITTGDRSRAVWQRYTAAIEADEAARAAYPSEKDIAAALESLQERAASGDLSEPYTEPSVTLPAGHTSADDKISDEERELDLPWKSGEHQLRNQEVFYGKREQTDAGVSP